MFKSLLTDQFKLTLHPETRNLPAYELVVDSDGPKFQESQSGVHNLRVSPGALNSQGVPMLLLAEQLSMRLGRPVVDRTGLKGHYAFDLHWTPDASEEERLRSSDLHGANSTAVPSGPPLIDAVQQQLGLKLVPVTEPVQLLVIDHAELPSAN
jgi:uncharacterized protein (TIGR03435 family)